MLQLGSGKEGRRSWKLQKQEVGKISKDGVRKALKRMKNGEAVGPDEVPVGVLMCLGERAGDFLMK